jgi:hypothetical protein
MNLGAFVSPKIEMAWLVHDQGRRASFHGLRLTPVMGETDEVRLVEDFQVIDNPWRHSFWWVLLDG